MTRPIPEGFDSSICPHLRVTRTVPLSGRPDWKPPFPAFSARFDPSVKELCLAVIGAQAPSASDPLDASVLLPIASFLRKGDPGSSRPGHAVECRSRDRLGRDTRVLIAYWSSGAALAEWRRSSGFDAWFGAAEREREPNGWFLEILVPSLDRYETIFSSPQEKSREGAINLPAGDGLSGLIQEHGYWGSARDRFPVTQTDRVEGTAWRGGQEGGGGGGVGGKDAGSPSSTQSVQQLSRKRFRVSPRRNLCVIRSGQDWNDLAGAERDMYLTEIHPTLERGMNFLRDSGAEVGCFDCRFMAQVGDVDLAPAASSPTAPAPASTSTTTTSASTTAASTDKTFGFAFFDDLTSLEEWSKSHETHLAIFRRFNKYVAEFQAKINLKLYHEIVVLREDQQFFEYVNCHPGTGMLSVAGGAGALAREGGGGGGGGGGSGGEATARL